MKKNLVLKIIIFSLIFSLLVASYIYGFSYLKNKGQSIADRKASIDNQISQIEESINDKKQSDAVSKMSSDINQHFLKSSDVPKFLSELEDISGRTGSIISIDSVDESDTELALGITANGTYSSIYRTIVELENVQYLSSINNMSLTFSHDNNDTRVPDFKKKPELQSSWSLVLRLVIKSYVK